MKKSFFVLILLLMPHFIFSQVKINQNRISDYKNEVGIELGGNCLLYAPYYQREILRRGNAHFNIRIGASLMPDFDFHDSKITFSPSTSGAYILPNVLLFSRKHAWELGLGLTLFSQAQYDGYYSNPNGPIKEQWLTTQLYYLTPQIGYRAYFNNSRFYFRTALSTFLFLTSHQSNGGYRETNAHVIPWAGFGFGYCFGKN